MTAIFKKLFCLTVLCSVFLPTSLAQESSAPGNFFDVDPARFIYGEWQGLDHPYVYCILPDSKGRIWASTTGGVAWLVDHNVQVLAYNYTLPYEDNGVAFYICEDDSGTIWFADSYRQLSYFKNDEFHPYEFQDTIKKYIPPNRHFDGLHAYDNNVYLAFFSYPVKRITPEGLWVDSVGNYAAHDTLNIDVHTTPLGAVGTAFTGKSRIRNNPYQAVNFSITQHSGQSSQFSFDKVPQAQSVFHVQTALSGDDLYIAVGNAIYVVREDKVIAHKMLEGDIEGISFDKHGRFLVSSSNRTMILDRNTLDQVDEWFEGQGFRTVLKGPVTDYEGGTWIATLGSGIIYMPDLRIRNYSGDYLKTNNRGFVTSGSDYLFFGQYHNRVLRVSKDGDTSHLNLGVVDRPTRVIPYLLVGKYSNNLWYVGDHVAVEFDASGTIKHNTWEIEDVRFLSEAPDSSVWLGSTNNHIYHLVDDGPLSEIPLPEEDLQIIDIKVAPDNVLWITSQQGLFSYQDGSWSGHDQASPLFGNRIHSSLAVSDNGLLGVGVYSNGPLLYDGETVYTPSIPDSSTGFKHISTIDYETFAFKNPEGLFRIDATKRDSPIVQRVSNYFGLPKGRFFSGTSFGGKYYAAVQTGLLSYDPEIFDKADEPDIRLLIEAVKINSQKVRSRDQFVNNYDRNNLWFRYQGWSGKMTEPLVYRHRLTGLDDNWTYTLNKEIQYTSLDHGHYTFEVQVRNLDGSWSQNVQRINFIIHPPYWATWWFIGLCVLVGLAIITLIFRWQLNRVNRVNALKNQMFQFQQRALAARINPHFIYNAMNSIQGFVLQNDSSKASYYLERFGGLIRKVLNLSSSELVTLNEEVETLEKYLSLESIRLKSGFEFEFIIAPDLDKDYVKLPPMIIQPYLENAIWHGFRDLERKGKLMISFTEESDSLRCVVEDNGVGREQSLRKKENTSHQSQGMNTTDQRLELLSKVYKAPFRVSVVDLYEESGEARGTRIIIDLPLL